MKDLAPSKGIVQVLIFLHVSIFTLGDRCIWNQIFGVLGGRVVSPGGESENLSSEASTIVAGGGDLSQQIGDRIAEHRVESELDEPEPQGEECELDSSELAVLHQRTKPETQGGSQLNEDEASTYIAQYKANT